jgi:hypothetical protein
MTQYTSSTCRGTDMEKEHWNGCQFHAAGQCPQQRAIERISLIPQLLPPSEIEAARKACEKCGQRRGEKRKHARTKRPLPVVLSKDDLPPVQGDIINISRGGAILKVRDSVGYTPGEKVRLEIYSPHLSVSKTPTQAVQLLGSIKRVEAREQTLAITFVEENDR